MPGPGPSTAPHTLENAVSTPALTNTSRAMPSADVGRAADLRRMKRRATGLLLLVTAAFALIRLTTDGDGFAGYVEAAAEAAMVGGVADWFAVTALFRHPLGIAIPHTAIIPNRKDQIGESLGSFVQDNFLNDDLVGARVRDFGPAERLGRWLAEPENARRIGEQTPAVFGGVTDFLDDDDVAAGVGQLLARRLETIELAPLASRGLEVAIEGGHNQVAFDATLRGVDKLVTEHHEVLRQRLYEESPWWVPETIDDRVFSKITTGITSLVADVLAKPDHQLRGLVDQRARDLAVRLRESPELQRRGEELKAEILTHPEVRAWLNSIWDHIKTGLMDATVDPESELRYRLEAALVHAGETLMTDPALQAKVDAWIERVVRYLVNQSEGEVASLISSTVARWDADQTGERIELQVGRDLQFIRINGTVVGGLVGVVIHAIATLL